MNRECPHPNCGKPIHPSMFACKPHWGQLPTPLKQRIWAAYRQADWPEHRSLTDEAKIEWASRKQPTTEAP